METAVGVTAPFRHAISKRHQYARDWKLRTGGKIFGYFCTYVPEEVIFAGDILPVRIYGSHEPQDITDAYVASKWCPFSKDCLAQGLQGRYDYLDGIVSTHTCFHIQQTYTVWASQVPTPFSHHMFVPSHIQSPRAVGFLTKELTDFRQTLEGWLGGPISNESLDDSIHIYNTNRRLMSQVYELRKRPVPPISGAEAMEMVIASSLMDKREHNLLVERLLYDLEHVVVRGYDGVRLMVVGSEVDDVELVRNIESLGACIVIDDHCSGSRYFWGQVVPAQDRLQAIATRYVDRPSCAHKDLVERRCLRHMLGLAKEYKVQGVLFLVQKFCDAYLFDLVPMEKMFAEHSIPTLFLETDTVIPWGQFRTRIEAFLELLQQ